MQQSGAFASQEEIVNAYLARSTKADVKKLLRSVNKLKLKSNASKECSGISLLNILAISNFNSAFGSVNNAVLFKQFRKA